MQPYLTTKQDSSVVACCCGVELMLNAKFMYRSPSTQYALFGVIVHEGQLSTGHYTNYTRMGEDVRHRLVLLLLLSMDVCSGII